MKKGLIVIFGATGDLTKRKLIPALSKLYDSRLLSHFRIVCVSRRNLTKKDFLKSLELNKFSPDSKKAFLSNIDYFCYDLESPDDSIKSYLNSIAKKHDLGSSRLFYLAVSPDLFSPVVSIISKYKLKSRGSRIVFEKPFGHDLQSAIKLNNCIKRQFSENEIYRIDHYLGKELVNDLFVFRFANKIFDGIWNNEFIDHVQITIAETDGVGFRGGYYDKYGALKDMVQNHILQLISLIGMEEPKSIMADDIRDKKVKFIKSLKQVGEVVYGQYAGYLKEKGVDRESKTETFAALKFVSSNGDLKNVPFYVRTGKALADKYAEVNIVLKDIVCKYFCDIKSYNLPNVINISIQPNQEINLRFYNRGANGLIPAKMTFNKESFYKMNSPESYEVLLNDILNADQTHFTRLDFVRESWKIIDKIAAKKIRLLSYKKGSLGPKNRLIEKDKRDWIERD